MSLIAIDSPLNLHTPCNKLISIIFCSKIICHHFTLLGPSPPNGLAEDVTIVGVSYELAIIQWVVQYIAYTPETYRIQYRKEGEEEVIQTSIPIMGSTNFSAVNEQFTLALDGLDANATYYATVVPVIPLEPTGLWK